MRKLAILCLLFSINIGFAQQEAASYESQLQVCRRETAAFSSGDRTQPLVRDVAFRFLREFNQHLESIAAECGSTVSGQNLVARGCVLREELRECLFQRNEAYLALLAHAGFSVERRQLSLGEAFQRATPPYDLNSIRIEEPKATSPAR
jgi:hypothetical protein